MPAFVPSLEDLEHWRRENPGESKRIGGLYREVFQREHRGEISLDERVIQNGRITLEESKKHPIEALKALKEEVQQAVQQELSREA